MTKTQIIGLIIVYLILLGGWLFREIEDAPFWDEEHGFYTDEEIKEMKEKMKDKLKDK